VAPLARGRLLIQAIYIYLGPCSSAIHGMFDFIRLATEDYFFVCRTQTLELEPVKRMLAHMRGSDFDLAIAGLYRQPSRPDRNGTGRVPQLTAVEPGRRV